MLYIKDYIDDETYTVLDSEDGSVEVVTINDLLEAARLGIKVRGVTTDSSDGFLVIKNIVPYSVSQKMLNKLLKTQVILGVDIRVSGPVITSVNWDNPSCKDGTTIRLSDFGNVIGRYAFVGSSYSPVSITLIFDDKLQLQPKALDHVFQCDVCLDIHEVRSKVIVDTVYDEVLSARVADITKCVIDKSSRLDYYNAINIISFGKLAGIPNATPELGNKVEKYFRQEFVALLKSDFHPIVGHSANMACRDYVRSIDHLYSFWRRGCDDYITVRANDQGMFFSISSFSSVLSSSVMRFMVFTANFNLSEDMKKRYVKFCNRFNNQILDYGVAVGWIRGDE